MDDATGRVLVVDDNKVIRQLIRVNLELEGFEVVTAADGAECLDVVHQVRPDVITLDVVMPGVDGLCAAARLRADPRTRHLPIAIVSAGGRSEFEGGERAGVDAFVDKPFEPAELVRVVRRLMLARKSREPGPTPPPPPADQPSPSTQPPPPHPADPSKLPALADFTLHSRCPEPRPRWAASPLVRVDLRQVPAPAAASPPPPPHPSHLPAPGRPHPQPAAPSRLPAQPPHPSSG